MGSEIGKVVDIIGDVAMGMMLVALAVWAALVLALLGLLHLAGVDDPAKVVSVAAAGASAVCLVLRGAKRFVGLPERVDGAAGGILVAAVPTALVAGAAWAVQALVR